MCETPGRALKSATRRRRRRRPSSFLPTGCWLSIVGAENMIGDWPRPCANVDIRPRRTKSRATAGTLNGRKQMLCRTLTRAVVAALAVAAFAVTAAHSENIAVGNYGSSANGMPFAVALAKGYFQQEGANVTGIIASERRRHVGAQRDGRRRLRRGQSRCDRGRDPAGRRHQDRQRQRADDRRVRLAGEEGLADQDDPGPEGQEDRLHQSALDQPGARHPDAGRRPGSSPRTPSSSRPAASGRWLRRSNSARSTAHR